MKLIDYLFCIILVCFRIRQRIFTRRGFYNRYLLKRYLSGRLESIYHKVNVDKYVVKNYLGAKLGVKVVVPTIAYFRDPEKSMTFSAKSPCVIKPTHRSGQVLFLEAGQKFRMKDYSNWLGSYYLKTRQRMYKGIAPGVIVEPIVFDDRNVSDYKFFVFGGLVKFIQVDYDRFVDHKRATYDTQWNLLDFNFEYMLPAEKIIPPHNLAEMIEAAVLIGEDFKDVRVDMYSNGHEFLIGELTFFHGGAGEKLIGNPDRLVSLVRCHE